MLLKIPRDRFSAATKVSGVTELDSILLINSNSFVDTAPENVIRENTVFQLNPKFTFTEDEKAHKLIVNLALNITHKGDDINLKPLFGISAEYQLRYTLKVPPPPIEIRKFFFESFASLSSLYHVWPYWREFVDSTMRRMGVLHFECPLIKFEPEEKLPKKPKNASDSSVTDNSKERRKKIVYPKDPTSPRNQKKQ